MKRIFLFLLTIFLCFYGGFISAKTVDDVVCYYNIVNPVGDHMTYAQVYILGYKDGAGGEVVVKFKDSKGNYVDYADVGPTYDWENYGKTDSYSSTMLRFFTTDKKGATFIANYKKSSKCPAIYSNISYDGSTMDIENHSIDPETGSMTSKSISSNDEKLRSGNGSWESRADFYKDDSGNTTVKDDLVCSYDMEFDMYNIKSPVEFRTIYHPTNGTKSYKVSVN